MAAAGPVRKALKNSKAIPAVEKLAAGPAYNDTGYVLVDELGNPLKTERLRREAYKLMETAGVRKVRLYGARHATLSWMANNGVPETVVSAWTGHSDLSVTKRVYVRPDPQRLRDRVGEARRAARLPVIITDVRSCERQALKTIKGPASLS
ncbi:tyrosine-type recombinase/integrase [Kitasatospora sp. NPDC059577]|uniref:tyrosine-type recombinase/integrase n=1 Tax=unclassified Kitasatospora TaxID=2633591 RepID=UPI0036AD9316